MVHNPMMQHIVTDMEMILENLVPQLERVASNYSSGVNHGGLCPWKIVVS